MKKTTSKITIFEPDEEQLRKVLADRELSSQLAEFLKNLFKRKKWARKIYIPSGRNDVAVVLVFASTLKEAGLEIFSELHIFFGGKVIVEKWEVVGEAERISLLPKEVFKAIDIRRVQVEGPRVSIEFSVPMVGGQTSDTLVKTIDFSVEEPGVQIVPPPLSE